MNKLKLSSFLILFLISLNSCKVNYSFTGASISADVNSVSIEFFKNNAPLASPLMSAQFTEALRDIFLTQTRLALLEKNGDLQFSGSITDYRTAPVAISSGDIATASLNRLTVTIQVNFTNKKDEKQNFEQSFTRYADFDGNSNLSAVESSLIQEINNQLVQDIFNRSVSNW